MNPRQHAVAAVNAMEDVVCQLQQTWMKGEREATIKAIEHEIAQAVQAERDRCAQIAETLEHSDHIGGKVWRECGCDVCGAVHKVADKIHALCEPHKSKH